MGRRLRTAKESTGSGTPPELASDPTRRYADPSRRGVLAASLLGAALAGAGPTLSALSRRLEGEAPVRFWAADRDGQALFGLDEELFVRRRVPLRWPVRVVASANGGAFVATAEDGDARGAHGLWRVAADGSSEALLRAPGRLVPVEHERARESSRSARGELEVRDAVLAIEFVPGGASRLIALELDAGGGARLRQLHVAEGLCCAASRRGRILVGHAAGRLELLAVSGPGWRDSPPPTRRAFVRLDGALLDVARAGAGDGQPGGWWALVEPRRAARSTRSSPRAAPADLVRLGPNLERRGSVPVGLAARALVPVPGSERVWLAESHAPGSRGARRFGPGGALELEVQPLALAGVERGVASASGGVLWAAPGALLALDRFGEARPAQGGFTHLTDVARAH